MEDESSALVGTEGGVRLDSFEFYSTLGDVEMRASADLQEYLFRQHYLDGERAKAAYDAGFWADPLYHWVESLSGRAESATGQTSSPPTGQTDSPPTDQTDSPPTGQTGSPLTSQIPSPPTADLALESMVVLEGIYRSAELGREVTREEIVEAADDETGPTTEDSE